MPEFEPFFAVARQFMAHKGYPDLEPTGAERVEGAHLWYLDYELPEGHLVLEVSWTEGEGWSVFVWDFQLHR